MYFQNTTKILTILNCRGLQGDEQEVDDEKEGGEAGQVELGQKNYLPEKTVVWL